MRPTIDPRNPPASEQIIFAGRSSSTIAQIRQATLRKYYHSRTIAHSLSSTCRSRKFLIVFLILPIPQQDMAVEASIAVKRAADLDDHQIASRGPLANTRHHPATIVPDKFEDPKRLFTCRNIVPMRKNLSQPNTCSIQHVVSRWMKNSVHPLPSLFQPVAAGRRAVAIALRVANAWKRSHSAVALSWM